MTSAPDNAAPAVADEPLDQPAAVPPAQAYDTVGHTRGGGPYDESAPGMPVDGPPASAEGGPVGNAVGQATGNAARVARHRARLAAQGMKQINVQVPVAVHPVVKKLAKRLRDGEDLTVVLFDLVADVTAAEVGRGLPPLPLPERGQPDRRLAPRPPLEKAELKRPGPSAPTRPGEEDELVRRVRQTLRRGGWRASMIRRMVE